jgi:hypothetical protein
VAPTVIIGLLLVLAVTFVSMALLVRTSFGRIPHPITLLPVPLVLYGLWMSAWFVFECLRQFLLTAMTPGTALRVVALIFLAAALLSIGFLYGCLSAVQQLLGGSAARRMRRVRRGAKYLALVYAALLIVGWSGYHFNGHSLLFTTLRRGLGDVVLPLALAAWVSLLLGARSLPDLLWRASINRLARAYVWLFSVMTVVAAVRDRLEAFNPVVPLAGDVFFVLAYALITVLWTESVENAARPGGSAPVA